MEEVAETHGVVMATVALAWVAAQPGIVAPISSPRNPDQLKALVAYPPLDLSDAELTALTEESA